MEAHLEPDRDGAVRGERVERRPEAAVGQDRGVDALRELAHLLDRALGVLEALLDEPRGGSPVAAELAARELERDDRVDEPLLRAVVEVTLEAPARIVG